MKRSSVERRVVKARQRTRTRSIASGEFTKVEIGDSLTNAPVAAIPRPQSDPVPHVLSKVSHASENQSPPKNAELFLYLLLERKDRVWAIGDFVELYSLVLNRLGPSRAKLWAYGEVIRAVWPLARRVIGRGTGLVAVTEWVRRHVL
jgi:hypothetical protein